MRSALFIFLLTVSVTGTLYADNCTATAHDSRPNIILIMSDDMGYSDIGCYGGEIDTPNLNRLASNGLRFTQFYNTGRCCPTRACLLTGVYPHQAGVGHMMNDRGYDGYRGDLNKQTMTIAEVLKNSGYATYMSGKWHVTKHTANDGPKFNWPQQRGFDKFYGTIHGAGSFYDPNSLTRGNEWVSPYNDPKYQPDTYYYTNAISDNATMFINEHYQQEPEKPFFMYVAYTAAHWPMHALPQDIAKYKGKYDAGYGAIRKARYERMKKMGLIKPEWKLSPQAWEWGHIEEEEWEVRCMEVYAAMIDRMDQGIGRIVRTLEQQGQLDNTLILFFQDNGGCAEGLGRKPRNNLKTRPEEPTLAAMKPSDFQTDMIPEQTRDGYPTVLGPGVLPGPDGTYIAYGEGWANVSNTPFRMYKHYVHEGGISTPLIAYWPKQIKRHGEFEDTPSHLIDLMATCVDVAKADYPKTFHGETIKPMEGRSLVPAFHGREVEREAIYWEHEGNRAIRVGDWKLVARGKNGPWELYNIAEDRSEMNDLANTHPDRTAQMEAMWQKWAERANVLPLDPRPEATFKKNKKKFKLSQGDDLNRENAPYIEKRGFQVSADVELTGNNGVIIAQGGSSSGWSLYLNEGILNFAIRRGGKLHQISSSQKLTPQKGTVSVNLEKEGYAQLSFNSDLLAEGQTGLVTSMPQDGIQVGSDQKGAVGNYETPYLLEGNVLHAEVIIEK
ncbi:MAG: arylsulfatase [Planctomycetaceae bacterium]|nr:arylsulfatase [Planctomycetaceae bacterium]